MTEAAEPEALSSVFPDDPYEPGAAGAGGLGSSRLEVAGGLAAGQGRALRAVLDSLDVAVLGYDRSGRTILMNQAAQSLVEELGEPAGDDDAVHSPMLLFDTTGRRMDGERHPVARALRGEFVRHVEVCAHVPDSPARRYLAQGGPVYGAGRLAAVLAFHDVTLLFRAKRLRDCVARVAAILGEPGPAGLIVATAVRTVGIMLGWAASEFWTVDRVGQVIQRRNGWQADANHSAGLGRVGDQLRGAGLAGRAWQSRKPVWVTDLLTDPLTAAQTDWAPLRAALAVPVPSGSSVLGVLICYSVHNETPDDMRTAILTSVAVQLGEFLERRRADDSCTALEHSRDEYITLVGHELRTPLTSIQANAEMLRAEPDMPAGERQQMLEVIQRRAEDLNRIVATLLDVAGTRAGHISLHCRRIDLAEMVRAAAARDDPAAGIDVEAPAALPVHADPDRIRIAVDELLRNARTWAPSDSRIRVTVRGDQRTVVVTVSNSGPPIPADQHARVFELFYRSDDLRHGGVPGSGLGLTLARAIVEQHRGTLTVSEPDATTTTFTIRLPRHIGRD